MPTPLPTFNFKYLLRRSKKSILSPKPKKCSSAPIAFTHLILSPCLDDPPVLLPITSVDNNFPSAFLTSRRSGDLYNLIFKDVVCQLKKSLDSADETATDAQSYFTTIHGSLPSKSLFHDILTRNICGVQNSILIIPFVVVSLYSFPFCWNADL